MKAELTAIIEKSPEGGFWAICPEFPGANGQGETIEETKKDLCEAIQLIIHNEIKEPLAKKILRTMTVSFTGMTN